MALAEISRVDVLKAIAEYQELGRKRFLSRHNFREARQRTLFATCVELAVLEDVDGFGQVTGPVRAAT